MTSNERLEIKKFLCISDANIEINRYLVLIGPQSSGKSIVSKLIWWARSVISDIYFDVQNESTYRDIIRTSKEKFENLFQLSFIEKDMYIKYTVGNICIEVTRQQSNKIKIALCQTLVSMIKALVSEFREKKSQISDDGPRSTSGSQRELRKFFNNIISKNSNDLTTVRSPIYAPAARSFFSQIEDSLFFFLSSNSRLDPVVEDFGSYLRWVKDRSNRPGKDTDSEIMKKLSQELLKGNYSREGHQEFITHSDGRKVPVSSASSGQQEILPLCLILNNIHQSIATPRLFVIEEPEAHLHPSAQKSIVEAICHAAENSSGKVIITTHSPYILSVINNLYLFGKTPEEKKNKISTTFLFDSTIPEGELSAYCLCNGEMINLIDPDLDMIDADSIDSVSMEISQDFDTILSNQEINHDSEQ